MYKMTLKDALRGKVKKGMRRDGAVIVREILEICWGGSKKTRIMFQANLNPRLLKKYLDFCIEYGFLKQDASGYVITEKGKKYVRLYGEMIALEARYGELSHEFMALVNDRSLGSPNCVELPGTA